MDSTSFFSLKDKHTAIIAFALHDGHYIAPPFRAYQLLGEQERAREEDPYTGYMIASLPVSTLIVHTSRFQLDLNRPRAKAIYIRPEDAWGLRVWQPGFPAELQAQLYQQYDQFFDTLSQLLDQAIATHGHVILLDVHSYNHRRADPFSEATSEGHPEINLGTWYNHESWRATGDRYAAFLQTQTIQNHEVDVRQNVIFKGGGFAQWALHTFGRRIGALSIEFKKTFMDEWTGIADVSHVLALKTLLETSIPFLENELKLRKSV